MDNRTEDFMAAARDRACEAIREVMKRADSKDQALHIALAGATGAIGTAVGALAALQEIDSSEIDAIELGREVLAMMEAARP